MRSPLPIVVFACAAFFTHAAGASEFHASPGCCAPAGPPPAYVIPRAVHTGYPLCSPATPYAYGWFGVQRRRHHSKSVHYGYYNNRVQHSQR